jgi:ADP-ribose pyrophosphatase
MPKPWDVLGTRTTYKDRWLTLRTDRCRTESGHVLESFHVLEFSDWINVVAITTELEVITVREYRHGAGKVVMGLPAGTMDKAGEEPLECARRELSEETGYGGGIFYNVGMAHPNPAIQNNLVHSFLAVNVVPTHPTQFDPGENIELVRERYVEFLRRSLREGLPFESLHIAAFHQSIRFILNSKVPELTELKRLTLAELNGL